MAIREAHALANTGCSLCTLNRPVDDIFQHAGRARRTIDRYLNHRCTTSSQEYAISSLIPLLHLRRHRPAQGNALALVRGVEGKIHVARDASNGTHCWLAIHPADGHWRNVAPFQTPSFPPHLTFSSLSPLSASLHSGS